MNEALELIKKLGTEDERCDAVNELLEMKDIKIKLLENVIEEYKILLDSCKETLNKLGKTDAETD